MLKRFKLLLAEILTGLAVKGSFIRNFAIVFSGKSTIFLVGFLMTPFIARIFTPEAYGTYALYSVIVLNLSILVTLRLPTSFVIIKSDRDFLDASRVTTSLIVVGTVVIWLVFTLFDEFIYLKFENKNLIGLGYIIGIGVFLNTMTDFMGNWNVREKAFSKSTKVVISESIGTKGGSLLIGLITHGISTGLIIGEFIGKTIHLVVQAIIFVKMRFYIFKPEVSIGKFKKIIQTFKEYPLLVMPSFWISKLSNTLIIFYLSAIYTPEFVGAFSMAIGLLMIPVMMVANASQPVLTHKVVESISLDRPIVPIVYKFVYTMIFLSSIPIFLSMLLGEPLIDLFLGEGWEVSSILITWMSPLILLHMLYAPLNGVLLGLKKNKQVLIASLIKLFVLILTFTALPHLTVDFYSGIRWFVLGSSLSLIASILYMITKIGIPISLKLRLLFSGYVLGCLICYRYIDFF